MEFIIREVTNQNWMTIVLVVCLSLLAIVKVLHPIGFSDFMLLFTTDKYFVTHQKTNKISNSFTTLLLLVQSIAIALFGYLGIRTLGWYPSVSDFILFFQVCIGYIVLLCAKVLIDKIIATIFSIEDIIDKYQFYKITYRNFIGVLLLPIIILSIYTFTPTPEVFIGVLILIGVLNLIILFSVFKKNEKIIMSNKYYFILYLCALEIAPYFILYKVVL